MISSLQLNAAQSQAVDFNSGPALVIAGAGTGKTRVLVQRAARLLAQGTAPDRILLLTFTRRSAQELKDRVAKCRHNSDSQKLPWCGTFHSTGARLLRSYGYTLGIPPSFSILDEEDAASRLWDVVTERYDKEHRRQWPCKSTLSKIHSYAVNTRKTLNEALFERYPQFIGLGDELQTVFDDYERRKMETAAVDYDDLLVLWLKLLRHGPGHILQLFEYIMVDEYQDTNTLQAEILLELSRGTSNIMVVGDDAQAIYGFRGATVRNILDFSSMFAQVATMKLELNYRSTQEILDISNSLLTESAEFFPKNLRSFRGSGQRPQVLPCQNEWDQADQLVAAVLALRHNGVSLQEQAVLFRSSFHSFKIEMMLQRNGIAYKKFGGIRLADSAHVKDVLAFLRCRENPWDESAWRRVFELLPGIGPATAAALYSKVVHEKSPAQFISQAKLPEKARHWVEGIAKVVDILFSDNEPPLTVQLEQICLFYQKLLPELHDNWEARWRELEVLLNLAGRYSTRREFLDDILVGDDSVFGPARKTPADCLTLSTIHSAKGCEWDCVHVIQLIEGGLPILKDEEEASKVDEERRLLYVAMTRARNELRLYYPQNREPDRGRGTSYPCTVSRFLTPSVVGHCLGAEQVDCDPDGLYYDFDDC